MHRYQVPEALEQKIVARRGRLHPYESFPGDKTALVVVDMQIFFMSPTLILHGTI